MRIKATFFNSNHSNSNFKIALFLLVLVLGFTACEQNQSPTASELKKISGDNQIQGSNLALDSVIKVQVLDQSGNPKSDVLVSFAVTAGGGSSSIASALSNSSGYAQAVWTLGSTGVQTMSVSAKKADGTALQSSPQVFTATINNPPVMISVPGGTFTMGGDPDVSYQVTPMHQVTLSNFQISKYEITNAQFAAFLTAMGNQVEGGVEWYIPAASGSYSKITQNGSNWAVTVGYENTPVVNVSWYGAAAYCAWAGGRLPTEAEWEYAAKGGNQSAGYAYSGSNNIDAVAMYYGIVTPTEAQAVGQKTANELGIYDMSGNVWEWCSDWFDVYSSSAQTNPTGAASGTYRVLRGGGWYDNADYCRSSYRSGSSPDFRYITGGFRLVL